MRQGWIVLVVLVCVVLAAGRGVAVAQTETQAPPPPPTGKSTSGPYTGRVQGGFGLLVSSPTGEFDLHGLESIPGISAYVGASLGHTIFSWAGEASYWRYDTGESHTVSLDTLAPEVPKTSLKVSTRHEAGQFLGRFRAQKRQGRFRPFAEVVGGFTMLGTNTSINLPGCHARPIWDLFVTPVNCDTSESNLADVASSWGGGAGIWYGKPGAWLEVSVRGLKGGRADYLAKGGLRSDGGTLIKDTIRSRTDLSTLYIGIAFSR